MTAAAASGRTAAAWAMGFLSDADGASESRRPRSSRCSRWPDRPGRPTRERGGRADPRGRRSRRSVRPLPRGDPACRGPDGVRRHRARRPSAQLAAHDVVVLAQEPSDPGTGGPALGLGAPRRQPRGHAPRSRGSRRCWGWAPTPASWPRATSGVDTRVAPGAGITGTDDAVPRHRRPLVRAATARAGGDAVRRRRHRDRLAGRHAARRGQRRAVRPPRSPTTSHGPSSRTRQGNVAWAGQKRETESATAPIRSRRPLSSRTGWTSTATSASRRPTSSSACSPT